MLKLLFKPKRLWDIKLLCSNTLKTNAMLSVLRQSEEENEQVFGLRFQQGERPRLQMRRAGNISRTGIVLCEVRITIILEKVEKRTTATCEGIISKRNNHNNGGSMEY